MRSYRKKGEENPTIECACGCGKKLKKYNNWGNSRSFIDGHRIVVPNMEYLEVAKKRFWVKVDKRKKMNVGNGFQ